VNNSGITWGAPYDDFPEAKGWDNVMAVNVKSIFYSEDSFCGRRYSSINAFPLLLSDFWVSLIIYKFSLSANLILTNDQAYRTSRQRL
jgi:NAD(P)-dependent dehydrogenase (short-subunit alcohol dehydrogenase family)